jgi:hypothetical protein
LSFISSMIPRFIASFFDIPSQMTNQSLDDSNTSILFFPSSQLSERSLYADGVSL